MPIDEQQKNTLVINVSNLMRHSHVKVDAQRFSLAFRTLIEDLEPGQPVDLEPIFEYLKSQQEPAPISEKEALELCIVIASRKDKLGVPFTLPTKAQALTTEALETIVGVHNEKRKDTGSWEVRRPEPEKPAEKKSEPGWAPTKGKKPADPAQTQRRLLAALGVCVAAAIAFHVWNIATDEPNIAPIEVPAQGLRCTELVANQTTAICTLPLAVYEGGAKETLKAQALLTKNALKSRGVTAIWVKTAENNRIVMVE